MKKKAEFGNLLELASVRQQIDAAAVYAANEVKVRVAEGASNQLLCWIQEGLLESPLEAVFAAWWYAYQFWCADSFATFSLKPQNEIVLFGQRRYRSDFTVVAEGNILKYLDRAKELGLTFPRVVVELDGHDFHERTKEQVAYRNQRDRDLIAAGWMVFHFSGSELYRDPSECVAQVWTFCDSAAHDIFAALWRAEAASQNTDTLSVTASE